MKKSMAKFGDLCEKPKPLVGADAPRAVLRGNPVLTPFPVVPDTVIGLGGIAPPGVMPLQPTDESPSKSERPCVVVPAKPSCVPISCANEREADTTRASISTC